MDELYLIRNKNGTISLCLAVSDGMVSFKEFGDLQELERFGIGILGFCQHYTPVIPEPFVKAFEGGS